MVGIRGLGCTANTEAPAYGNECNSRRDRRACARPRRWPPPPRAAPARVAAPHGAAASSARPQREHQRRGRRSRSGETKERSDVPVGNETAEPGNERQHARGAAGTCYRTRTCAAPAVRRRRSVTYPGGDRAAEEHGGVACGRTRDGAGRDCTPRPGVRAHGCPGLAGARGCLPRAGARPTRGSRSGDDHQLDYNLADREDHTAELEGESGLER